jgi:hypothetical protein
MRRIGTALIVAKRTIQLGEPIYTFILVIAIFIRLNPLSEDPGVFAARRESQKA